MTVHLNEYDKLEWLQVARVLKPSLTEEEYDEMWADFQRCKEEHLKSKGLN